MPMLAHFEELSSTDRRGFARRALTLGVGTGTDPVTILDLSLTGALLETSIPMLVGSSFEVDLPHAGRVEAVVVWNGGEYYGCQFELPISPAALSAALLQGESADPAKTSQPGPDPMNELRELSVEVERLAFRMESALKRLAGK
jgi:hypothetical protein